MLYKCPVCNYKGLFEPAYNKSGYGSDDICPCCGFQFGYHDYPNKEENIKKWRENWINRGCPWHYRTPPEGWDSKKQIEGL